MRQLRDIDVLVVSHGDNDHIGGTSALIDVMPAMNIKTSVPNKFTKNKAALCLAGEKWNWDGVSFEFIYPDAAHLGLGNDSSCVLKVSNKRYAVLLTGDIEKIAERYLIDHDANLQANVLIAPHHGSKTSGMTKFIGRVSPDYVLFPTGYRNRYRFPHHAVVEKYKKAGSLALNVAFTGAVRFQLSASQHKLTPELYRYQHRRYWSNPYCLPTWSLLP